MSGNNGSRSTRLIFVRHGETIWNSQSRWQGWQDSSLTETGIAQAEAAADNLRTYQIDAIYSSDSGRALRTAEIIAAHHQLEVIPTEALRERNYGGYEGLNSQEIDDRFPGTRYLEGRDTRDDWRPPGGESMADVRERVGAFVEELLSRHKGRTVLLATHSGVVRAVDSICADKPLDELWHRAPRNACIFEIEHSGSDRFIIIRDHCEEEK